MQMMKSVITNAPVYADVPAHDIQRAKTFYHDQLGFETQDIPGDMFIAKAGQGTQFMVYQTEATDSATVCTFIVPDVDTAAQDLRDHGIQLEQYDMPETQWSNGVATYSDGTKSAWFKDSEGNALNIASM